MLSIGGGGIIKEVVFDLTSFIRKELTDSSLESSRKLKDFLTSNSTILNSEDALIFSDHHLALRNWLYIIFGYLALSYREQEVDRFLDKIIDMYLDSRSMRGLRARGALRIADSRDKQVLDLIKEYYENVAIRHDLLYPDSATRNTSITSDDSISSSASSLSISSISTTSSSSSSSPGSSSCPYIMFHETHDEKVFLPPLPKIHDKELLVKALMHKEYYRMLLTSTHPFAGKLTELGFDLDHRNYTLLKYELSFLDGLGDLFLAHESSKLIYELCRDGTMAVSNNTYHMLRTILATNTLLSKLTVAYNLHKGLDDAIIAYRLESDYLLNLHTGNLHPDMDANETRIYEEEFLGDYFESYMGALVIEQPDVAEAFIGDIYNRILLVITKVLPPDVSYRIWTTGILGRNLHHK